MRKNIFVVVLITLTLALSALAQEKKEDKKMMPKDDKKMAYEVDPADVSTIDGIIKATYDVISGDKSTKRNWDRFRTLFHDDGRLIPTRTDSRTKATGARSYTPDEYIERSEPFMMQNGFFEKEIARRVETFGNIAHVFSTYEGRNNLSDEKPFLRGINSFQLLNDGKRWWIISIYWQAETPDNPLPAKYLESK